MAERRQWLNRAGIGAIAAALLVSGLRVAAQGDETAGPQAAGAPPGAVTASASPTAAGASPAAGTTTDGAGGSAQDAAGPGAQGAAARPPHVTGGLLPGLLPPGPLPPMGAFTDSGAEGVRSLAGLQTWLGGTPVTVGHTYLPGGDWSDIEGAGDLLRPWADWRRADPGRLFVLNVPMQAGNEDHVPDGRVRALIRQGASGAFDDHFTRLAQRLVGLGVPDTVIVLGWEMNGETYTHRCGPDPQGWKTYWNRIVAAMRAVPGQHFRFDFAPNRGRDAVPWTECYPGDGSVDIVGMDSYDQPGGESFFQQVDEPYGLAAQVRFAAAHDKEISYPEWGLFRNGDDPDYMSLMLAWIVAHRPVYQTITDYCPHGVWQCRENPQSTAVYRGLLYGRGAASSPSPSSSAAPTGSPSGSPSASGTPTGTPVASGTPSAVASPGVTPAGPSASSCATVPLDAPSRERYDATVCLRLRPTP